MTTKGKGKQDIPVEEIVTDIKGKALLYLTRNSEGIIIKSLHFEAEGCE